MQAVDARSDAAGHGRDECSRSDRRPDADRQTDRQSLWPPPPLAATHWPDKGTSSTTNGGTIRAQQHTTSTEEQRSTRLLDCKESAQSKQRNCQALFQIEITDEIGELEHKNHKTIETISIKVFLFIFALSYRCWKKFHAFEQNLLICTYLMHFSRKSCQTATTYFY